MPTLDEAALDEPDRLADLDRSELLRAVATAGAQVRESRTLSTESGLTDYLTGHRPRALLLAGDPIAHDVVRTVAAFSVTADAPAPVLVYPEPDLPVWAGPLDLVLAASASVASERAATLVEAATRRGVPVVGAGIEDCALAEVCGRNRAPFVGLPPGRAPRATYWGLLVPLLWAAAAVGLVTLTDEDVDTAANTLDALAERCRPASETFVNPAKSLALDLAASQPVIWGTSPITGAAAHRFAGLLAGAARLPAVAGTLPAAAYRTGGVLDGTDAADPDDIFRDRVDEPEPRRPRLVAVRDVDEATDVHQLVEATIADLRGRGGAASQLVPEEGGPLTRLASLVGLADFTAVYAGLAQGVDPSGIRTGAHLT